MQDDHNVTALARIDVDFAEQGASLRVRDHRVNPFKINGLIFDILP
jgi:hypothetical protein